MNQRNRAWRAPGLFALGLLPFAAVGGWCTGSYSLATFPEELRQTMLAQIGGAMPLYFMAAVQSVLLAFICGGLGYALSRAVGLMRPLQLEKGKLLPTLGITLGCGVFFSLDYWTFGRWLPQVREGYESGLLTRRLDNWLSSILYGGIIEEVLLRLFCMSLAAFLIWKLFFQESGQTGDPRGRLYSGKCSLRPPVRGGTPASYALHVRCPHASGCASLLSSERQPGPGFRLALPQVWHPVRHAGPRRGAYCLQVDLAAIDLNGNGSRLPCGNPAALRLFLPAGTLTDWNGWLFLGILMGWPGTPCTCPPADGRETDLRRVLQTV